LATQPPHYQLEKEKRCFCRLTVFGKVILNAFFFFAPKRWVRGDDIDTILLTDFT